MRGQGLVEFMVVLGSDDGLIASGERAFISGSPRPGLPRAECCVLGHLFHNSSTESPRSHAVTV